MPHPDEGLIHAWLDGELDAAEAARVETLVASDPEWAAAAAEARGLLAASSRIVGSLDRVPANVIPKSVAAPRHPGRRWLLRAAAILVLIGGSAVVLNRASIDGGDITIPLKQPIIAPVPSASAPALPPAPAPAPAKVSAKPANPTDFGRTSNSASKSNTIKKELDESKQKSTLSDKDRNAPATEARVDAAASGAGANTADVAARRAAAAPAPAPAMPPAAVSLQQNVIKKAQTFSEQKVTRLQPVCFSQREPRDSAGHLILLDRDALADSIRLEKLTQRGDTLASVNGQLRAVRAPCPAP